MSLRKILYFEPIIEEYKQALEESVPDGFKVYYWNEMNLDDQQTILAETDYFLVVGAKISNELMQKAVKLRMVQRTGIGYDNVDVVAADSLGLPVAILPGGNGIAVAEHAILLSLALQRKLLQIDTETRDGEWPNWKYRSTSYEMDGKTFGFLGFGFIGKATATRAKAFGVNIIYHDLVRAPEEIEKELGAQYVSKEDVLEKSDIVSLHIPITKENKYYIGKNELALMKQSAFLINVSRGGLVDESALLDALVKDRIAGAGIDTWEKEPCPADNPLFALPNVVATAHIAAGTLDTFRKQVVNSFCNIILAEQTGLPNHTVGGVTRIRI